MSVLENCVESSFWYETLWPGLCFFKSVTIIFGGALDGDWVYPRCIHKIRFGPATAITFILIHRQAKCKIQPEEKQNNQKCLTVCPLVTKQNKSYI